MNDTYVAEQLCLTMMMAAQVTIHGMIHERTENYAKKVRRSPKLKRGLQRQKNDKLF